MTADKASPLALAPTEVDQASPFAGDLFDRRSLAEHLTDLVCRLPHGGAIAIDAGWGEGKSWFARNWSADLRQHGFSTIYLDAFEADYVEDPFLLVSAELLSVVDKGSPETAARFREGVKKVGSVIVPVITKAAVRAVSVALTGIDFSKGLDKAVDAATEEAGDEVGELIGSAIKKRIEELQRRRKSVEAFRASLTELFRESEKPLVFLVDELDRCKPPFAVQLLERIKHFFTVPNLVFVLLLNKSQLEASVRGLYGADIDSNTYLSKFLTVTLTLPAKLSEENRRSEFAMRFCNDLGSRLGYTDRRGFDEFREALAGLAPMFRMSFREIERAFAYYAIAGKVEATASLVAYLCALKVSKPSLFQSLVSGSPGAHKQIYDFLNTARIGYEGSQPWIFKVVRAAHSSLFRKPDELPGDEREGLEQFKQGFRHHYGVGEVIGYWARRLDLQIS